MSQGKPPMPNQSNYAMPQKIKLKRINKVLSPFDI